MQRIKQFLLVFKVFRNYSLGQMFTEQTDYEKLLHRKNALTKWLLLAVLFNVLLQFESVENFFSIESHKSHQLVAGTELCGSAYSMELPSSSRGTIELTNHSGYLNPNSFSQTLGFFSKKIRLNLPSKTFNFVSIDVTEVPSFIPYSFSGLSPPLV